MRDEWLTLGLFCAVLLGSLLTGFSLVIALLIPWSIAGSVPLTTVGAPMTSLLLAVYLYLIPMITLLKSLKNRKRLSKEKRK